MKIQHLLVEQSAEQINAWMQQNNITNYEIHDDGSVDINQSIKIGSDNGDPISTLPFASARINGNAHITCYNANTARIADRFPVINGMLFLTIDVKRGAILSLVKIKGLTHVDIEHEICDGEFEDECEMTNETGFGPMIMQVINGEMTVFDLQEQLIDAGYPGLAKR